MIERISPVDLPNLIHRLRRVFSHMQFRLSRRYRGDPRGRALDMGKSIRNSFRFGGELFFIRRRRKKRRQPQVVVLCDVSASMIQYAGFTVPLLFAIARSARNSDAFVCAGDLEPVTEYFRQNQGFSAAVEKLLQETVQVGRGTQLGHAFRQLLHQPELSLNSSSCLLIISDAETVEPEASALALKALSGRVRRIIWLNTQRRDQWNRDVTRDFRRYCHMEECTSLQRTIQLIKSM